MKRRALIEIIGYIVKLLVVQFPLLLLYVSQRRRRFLKGMKKGMKGIPKDLRREILWKAKKRLSTRDLMKRTIKAGLEMKRGWRS